MMSVQNTVAADLGLRRRRLTSIAGLIVCLASFWGVSGVAHARTLIPGELDVGIVSVGRGGATVKVTFDQQPFSLKVAKAGDREALEEAHVSDQATVLVDDLDTPTEVTGLKTITRSVGLAPVILAMIGSAGALIALGSVFTKGRPQEFLIGVDRRYSNSQCQLALWFGAVAVVYAAALILRVFWLDWRFIGGVSITKNVMILTGLSAFTFGGAKVISTQKAADALKNNLVQPPAGAPNIALNLVQNDFGYADLGDFQMILITAVAVGIFCAASIQLLCNLPVSTTLPLPDVDSALLSVFGIGQGAYLFKKAALPAGRG